MDENMPEAMGYFEFNGWTQQQLKELKCSFHPDEKIHFIGPNQNSEGMNINCKGVSINVQYDNVIIATWEKIGGKFTDPAIVIDKYNFCITE